MTEFQFSNRSKSQKQIKNKTEIWIKKDDLKKNVIRFKIREKNNRKILRVTINKGNK